MTKKIATTLISIMLFASSPKAAVLPVGELEVDFIYELLERIESLTLDDFRYELAPYQMDNDNFSFGPLSYMAELKPGDLQLFSYVAADLTATRRYRSSSFESIRFGLVGRPNEKLFLYASATLDEARAKDENYRGKKWRGLAGDVDYALANYSTENFELSVGRFASVWGPRNSLVLSGNARMDGLAYSYHWGKLTISYRLASLDGLSPDIDTVSQFQNRYFAGHRFDLHFSPSLRVGLFETVVFGGPGRQLEFGYLNPLIFFHGNQLNQGSNDNTFIGLDFTLKPWKGRKFYGQLLIDDFQIDNKSQGDQEPDEYAFLVGTYLADLAPSFDLRLEYVRVTNRTYNQILERNRYLQNGIPLGAVRGNDYDETSLSLFRWFSPNLRAAASFSYYRQGEGNISDPFTQPWSNVQGPYSEPFPTGIVEKTTTASLGLTGFVTSFLFADLQSGVRRIRNFGNIDGDNRTLPFVNLRISTNFSAPVNLR